MIVESVFGAGKKNFRCARLFAIGLLLNVSFNAFSMNDTYYDNSTMADCTMALSNCTITLVQLLMQSSSPPSSPFGLWTDWNLEVAIEIIGFGIMTNIIGDFIAAAKPVVPWPLAYCVKGSKKLCFFIWRKIFGRLPKTKGAPALPRESLELDERDNYAANAQAIIEQIPQTTFRNVDTLFIAIGGVISLCLQEQDDQFDDSEQTIKVCQAKLVEKLRRILEDKIDESTAQVENLEQINRAIGEDKWQTVMSMMSLISKCPMKQDENTKALSESRYGALLETFIELLVRFEIIAKIRAPEEV
jgi:hypothetical protein